MNVKSSASLQEPVGRIGQRRQVVIPRVIFDNLRMREGDFVAFIQRGNAVLLKPKRLVDSDDVLTPAEAKKLSQGLRQVKEGKTRPWAVVKHELDL
jgi:bifunctional DNA-binding transcriptional regulator/antitoxin component of YhaV-PrlF toxin-antitoxin module